MLFAGLGFILLLKKDLWTAIIISIFPILLFIFVGRYKTYFPRNIVALIPFISIISGFFVSFLYIKVIEFFNHRLAYKSKLILAATFLMFLFFSIWNQFYAAINHINRITRPDTRWTSLEWIINSLPPGSKIGREHYTPPIEEWSDRYHSKYLGYSALIRKPGIVSTMDYMVLSSKDYKRYTDNSAKYPIEAKIYNDFFSKNKLVKEFFPGKNVSGPKISIYKLHDAQH